MIYNNTRIMPLTAYKKYLETQDVKYFSSKEKASKECERASYEFYDDFLKVSENRTAINRFVKVHEIEKLKGKYKICSLLIYSIRTYPLKYDNKNLLEFVEQLIKWGYKVNREKPLMPQINIIEQRLQGLVTKIEMLQSEFEKDDVKEAVSIEKQLNDMENIQEKKYRLKAEDFTVYEFLMMQKDCKLILEQRRKK